MNLFVTSGGGLTKGDQIAARKINREDSGDSRYILGVKEEEEEPRRRSHEERRTRRAYGEGDERRRRWQRRPRWEP